MKESISQVQSSLYSWFAKEHKNIVPLSVQERNILVKQFDKELNKHRESVSKLNRLHEKVVLKEEYLNLGKLKAKIADLIADLTEVSYDKAYDFSDAKQRIRQQIQKAKKELDGVIYYMHQYK